jgi:hypothetical protein
MRLMPQAASIDPARTNAAILEAFIDPSPDAGSPRERSAVRV